MMGLFKAGTVGARIVLFLFSMQMLSFLPTPAVAAEPTEDTTAPQILSLSFEPQEIDTSSSGQSVLVTAHIADDLSGFSNGQIAFYAPGGVQAATGVFKRISGSATDGIYRAEANFSRFSETGSWEATVIAFDEAGNRTELRPGGLQEAGLPFEVRVRAEGKESTEDKEPPELHALTIEPAEIDTSTSKQSVILTAHITDNLAGFEAGSFKFKSPSGNSSTGGGEFELVSGDANDGTYEILITFEQFSESGAWELEAVRLTDRAGNELALDAGQIVELGFAHSVAVAFPPPVVTGVSPASGSETGGASVQIIGSGLSNASVVRFGEAEASDFTVESPTSITAVAPAGHGTVDVTVTTPWGISATSAADRFRYSPPVTLTSKPNPSLPSSKVTFTASVDPISPSVPAPTGSVTFREGEEILGTVPLSAEGTASLKVASLAAGSHAVVAVYSGDSYFGSGEARLIQVVSRLLTQVTLTSSKNPASFGSSASVTATVQTESSGGSKPSGTITFKDGSRVLGIVPLSGKSAKCSLKGLSVGVHELTASYSGDVDFDPSVSAVLRQMITP